MKKLLVIVGILVGIHLMGCHEVTVGYLSTENAGYDPDSMIVKHELYVDSVKNPQWDVYYPIAMRLYELLGYATVEDCLQDLYGITEYEYTEDYTRWKMDMPWLSTKIQGVNGTQPRYVEIKSVVSESGDESAAATMRDLLTVSGSGMFSLPLDASAIPVGRYKISLTISNEGYSHDVNDVFTIIVVER